ncbi:MAG: hypothetical protein DWH97_12200 [Planctomycetota bacterium]|nr:MAG: hypothetical protein DWH97_12200 [Planctomycetota bacterium]
MHRSQCDAVTAVHVQRMFNACSTHVQRMFCNTATPPTFVGGVCIGQALMKGAFRALDWHHAGFF